MTMEHKYIPEVCTFLITFKLLNQLKGKKQQEITFSLCFKPGTIKKSLVQCQPKVETNNYQ